MNNVHNNCVIYIICLPHRKLRFFALTNLAGLQQRITNTTKSTKLMCLNFLTSAPNVLFRIKVLCLRFWKVGKIYAAFSGELLGSHKTAALLGIRNEWNVIKIKDQFKEIVSGNVYDS